MADERDEEPKIRIVDRRMLNDEERAGRAPVREQQESAPPKLEIIGGGQKAAPVSAYEQAAADEELAEQLEEELTEEEAEHLRAELENEQFGEIEQRMGRPLTEQEKDSVRGEMERQAQSAASLEVGPVLLQLMAELSARAAVHMGLMPNPYTRLIARNDSQARLAIDAYGAMFQVVRPFLDPTSTREFERVLNDLRVNFVSITGTPIAGPGPTLGGGPRIIH